jgi:hypothetical protein
METVNYGRNNFYDTAPSVGEGWAYPGQAPLMYSSIKYWTRLPVTNNKRYSLLRITWRKDLPDRAQQRGADDITPGWLRVYHPYAKIFLSA